MQEILYFQTFSFCRRLHIVNPLKEIRLTEFNKEMKMLVGNFFFFPVGIQLETVAGDEEEYKIEILFAKGSKAEKSVVRGEPFKTTTENKTKI